MHNSFNNRCCFVLVLGIILIISLHFLANQKTIVLGVDKVYSDQPSAEAKLESGPFPGKEIRPDLNWLKRREVLQKVSGDVRKVILFAYMHGGSTLLHEIFNHDPRAISWYEPLSGVYAHMYGLPENRNYDWIIMGRDEESETYPFRAPSQMEINHIVEFFQSTFNCDFEHLPREVLTNRFIMLNKALRPYAMCIMKFRSQKRILLKAPVWEHECLKRHGLDEYCGDDFYDEEKDFKRPNIKSAEKQNCSEHLDKAREIFENGNNINLSTINDFTSGDKIRLQKFYHNELCMQMLQQRSNICLNETRTIEKCHSRGIRTAKILRLKMPFIEPLAQAIPDLHIVYYVRDPRAIVSSRFGKPEPSKVKRWTKSVLRMCQEISFDLEAVEKLKLKYPGLISQFRYEDLVENTQDIYGDLYSGIGVDSLPKVYEWLHGALHGTENKGVQRVNALLVINKWRDNYDEDNVKYVTNHPLCQKLLVTLGYS